MKRYLQFIAVAIGGVAATKTNAYLLANNINVHLSLMLAAIAAVVIYKICEFALIELPYRNYYTRVLLEPNSAFEGHWVQTIDKLGTRFYSFVSIAYNHATKDYLISGEAIDSDGNIHSSWKSESLNIDVHKGAILYLYKAEMCDGSGETIHGYGIMSFFERIKGLYYSGKGYFVDSGTKLVQCNYNIDRVTNTDMRELIGKGKAYTTNDKRALIRKYHERYKDVRAISAS